MVKKIRLKKKTIKNPTLIPVHDHGVYYKLFKGELGGYNMNQDGSRGKEMFIVEEAPKSFKRIHIKVSRDLGQSESKLKKNLSSVYYY